MVMHPAIQGTGARGMYWRMEMESESFTSIHIWTLNPSCFHLCALAGWLCLILITPPQVVLILPGPG
jgi:hypothetical protein